MFLLFYMNIRLWIENSRAWKLEKDEELYGLALERDNERIEAQTHKGSNRY